MFDKVFKKPGAQQMFKCDACPKTFTNSLEAKRCLENCQKPASPVKSQENEVETQETQKSNQGHQCNHCVANFQTELSLEKHKSICHEDKIHEDIVADETSDDKNEEENMITDDNTEAVDPLVDNETNLDQGSDEEGEWSCIQCPEVLPSKKKMMHHVATDCKNKSPTKEASEEVTDDITDETAPPSKKPRNDESETETSEIGTPDKNGSWSPSMKNAWSKNKADRKLTARKSTGGKAPKDGGKILKCDKCMVILTTQDKLDQHVETCLVSKSPKPKTPPKKPVSPKMNKTVPTINPVQPLNLLPQKPVSPSKLSAVLKNSKERPSITIKPMSLLESKSPKKGSQNNGPNKVVKVMARPSGGSRVGGQAPSLGNQRGSNPGGQAPSYTRGGRGSNTSQNGMGQFKATTRFKCLQCPKSYVNKNSMEKHFQEVHKGVTIATNGGANNRRSSTRSYNTQPKQPTVVQKTLYKKVNKGIVLGEVDLCDSDDDLAESTPTPNKPTIATQPEPVSKQ